MVALGIRLFFVDSTAQRSRAKWGKAKEILLDDFFEQLTTCQKSIFKLALVGILHVWS